MNVREKALQEAVLAELAWDPTIGASTVQVMVGPDGVVTLHGLVRSFAQKIAAERAAKRVRGVDAVVNDIDVKLPMEHERKDPELAGAVVRALEWDVMVPQDEIKVTVSNGCVRLDGEVDWNYERAAAEDVVRHLTGVRGITNRIVVRPAVNVEGLQRRITDALERHAALESKAIKVEARRGRVTLRGRVHSWAEREAAEAAAWAAPGVSEVDDELKVEI